MQFTVRSANAILTPPYAAPNTYVTAEKRRAHLRGLYISGEKYGCSKHVIFFPPVYRFPENSFQISDVRGESKRKGLSRLRERRLFNVRQRILDVIAEQNFVGRNETQFHGEDNFVYNILPK